MSKDEFTIVDYLTQVTEMMRKVESGMERVPRHMSWAELVLKDGMYFEIADKETVTKYKPLFAYNHKRACYKNAFHAQMNSRNLVYCEGYATNTVVTGFPFEHAWVIDENGKVIDPKWHGVTYYGIPFDREYLWQVVLKKKTYGIMFSLDSPIELLTDGIPDYALYWQARNIGVPCR